ncbi:unnamed protein product [Thlaspi arvense]|uniref:Disease resistance R13L4/SHOC-2-like LRR domain-containing protein n=1 Tax=Thlaspi arvense TaxID=13288 RepID=A0AAU9RMU3_THLAR|nr:unnamed protein product [Thlaspi arvense]
MLPNAMTQSDTNVNTIDSMIATVSQLYKDIQLQDAYQDTDEAAMEEHTPVLTSKSIGAVTLEEITSEQPTIGAGEGTGFERTRSAPPRSLPRPVNQIRKLQRVLRGLKRNLNHMKSLQSDVERELNYRSRSLSLVAKDAEPSRSLHTSLTDCLEKDLENITNKLLDLMNKVPVPPEKQKNKKASPDHQDGDGDNDGKVIACLPGIHANEEDLKRLAVFRDVQGKFTGLSTERQICLLSFGVFPENQEVNRTMLMYWWIGEDILPREAKPEDAVKDILKEFMEKKLIEPVENKRKVEPNSYKMTPFVHSSVVLISEEIGLFNMYQKATKPKMKKSDLNKVCLVQESSSQPEAKGRRMKPENMETVFNVSEKFPEFTCKWFTSMTKLKVLYLGRWERTEREIEIDSRRVMKDLSSLKRLRFLSLQGISAIKSLSRSACKLSELIVLDFRDCYNLEKLPDDIHKLKNLIYLDLTGCDALERIPVRLSWLDNLEVLKGFVVSDFQTEITCELGALVHLTKLRKLSITVDRGGFGLNDLIKATGDFKSLEILKVRWGSRIPPVRERKPEGNIVRFMRSVTSIDSRNPMKNLIERHRHYLPRNLRKLDLQRVPECELPGLLQPHNLKDLEELHLRSWISLEGFGDLPEKPTECGVKVLRLKSLPKLKVEWRELTQLYFPKLGFLESYECPRVTFCPCDRDGIWRSHER